MVGYGPAGAATARLLVEQENSVRVVSRSPRPGEPGIDHVVLDATDTPSLVRIAEGATAIYHCACPPYNRWTRDWPPLASSVFAAAEASGAVLVLLSNLYGYGQVNGKITEDLPLAATGGKGRTRATIWQQARTLHEQGRIRVTEARASDFFGPGVTDGGHLAARVIPRLLRGQPVQTLGDPDAPHSWAYVPDVARAVVRLASEERAWGRAWHVPTAPPLSVRAMIDKLAQYAHVTAVPVWRMPTALVRVASLFSPLLRELQEVLYQFDRPFVVDSSSYVSHFNDEPTLVDDQVGATIDWWRQHISAGG